MLLWLWHRLAGVAPIQPLAWESPCAVGVALKRKKKKKRILTEKLKIEKKFLFIEFLSLEVRRSPTLILTTAGPGSACGSTEM